MKTTRLTKSPVHPFLKYQIGLLQKRPEMIPVYDDTDCDLVSDKRVKGYVESGKMVEVFYLLGFGETLRKAQIMAGV